MFEKEIPAKISEYKIFVVDSTEELVKVASDVDFPEGFVYDPDFLYMWVRIVSAGEYYGPNKNGDYFPEEELMSYWETFREAHPFKNHENKKIENAIGKIIHVRWNPVMKCVEILKGIDKKRAPEIARGYLKGYLTDVSMGCKVPYTVCSVCGNKARKRSEFCDHVRRHRLEFLGNGERVYEINYKPRFHDSSTVLNGAERVAKAFFIFNKEPDNYIRPAFRKAASENGVIHYIPYDEEKLEKVAEAYNAMHPLLQEETIEKTASQSPMLQKLAELEKELTGKLLNIVSTPDKKNLPAMNQMLEVIKFLTEKRLDETSLKNIALSVKEVANENGVPVSKAFATLIGVAELMGIEFFPHELHTLLRYLTDAGLNSSLEISDIESEEDVFPSDYTDGIQKAVICVKDAKDFHEPSSLLNLYDEVAHRTDEFADNPISFLSGINDGDDLGFAPPKVMIRVVKRTLEPIQKSRSYLPEFLFPRLSLVLDGHKSVMGGPDVRKDLSILSAPETAGDVLGRLAYHLYENIRPKLFGTRLIKVASEYSDGFEKSAAKYNPQPNIGLNPNRAPKAKGGLSRWKLALGAVPLAYATSAFQKNRREHGRFLSDGENFVADHPGIIAGGVVLGGPPLVRAVGKAAKKPIEVIKKAKIPFKKQAEAVVFEGMVKVADALPSGAFNVFDDDKVMVNYMNETGASGEEAAAVKMATLLSVGGMEKEAYEIMNHYNIPTGEKGRLLKIAASHMEDEMEKAAGDFTNNLILSAVADKTPMGRTLPGRALDAFLFKKLGDMLKTETPTDLPSKPDIDIHQKGGVTNV